MRIIQVLHSHGYGGAESHALTLMQGLQQRGHSLLYAGPDDSWLSEKCKQAGIETSHLRMAGMYDLFSLLKLKKLVNRWRADVVHGHLLRGARYAGYSAGNAFSVCTAHATTARKYMEQCSQIIAVSEAVKVTLLDAGYSEDKISVIHNGVALGSQVFDKAELRRELGIRPDAVAIFNAGRFIYDKGQDLITEVARNLSELSFYLAGDTDTAFGKEVRASASDLSNVHFLGYRNDIQRLLPAFDMYLSASRREALSLSLLEAAAASLPVVATSVGGIPEAVLDGVTGLLAPAFDTAALTEAMRRLSFDKNLRQRLGNNAYIRYCNMFTVDKMVDSVEKLYRGV